jgi:two-component sensor histidine kinase
MGMALTKQKRYAEALPLLKSGKDIAKKINHVEQLIESYNALGNYYSETNEFKNAYENALESQKLKDSVMAVTQDLNMAEALTKYEAEKKDAQLKVLSLETEKAAQQKELYLFLALGGFLVAALIGFFLFKNQKKNKLLAKQKKLLEATVDEKNILLKETHHRVKNSFQIVSSLLYLQSENIEDKEAKLAMKEAQNRVRSMVLIHQKLYSKDQLVGINTKEYFTDLTHDIFESHQFEGNAIKYSLEVESLVLGIETITPLGLILNELITNVIKHAFPTVSENSLMKIRFKKIGETLQLQVEDNGMGMPSEIRESSFGIQLIKSLAKKLKANLSFQSVADGGTIATLDMHRFSEL